MGAAVLLYQVMKLNIERENHLFVEEDIFQWSIVRLYKYMFKVKE